MKRFSLLFAATALAVVTLPAAAQSFSMGDATLDASLSSINVQASADVGPFEVELSATYGVSRPQIQTWVTVDRLQPAEVYLALELGRLAGKPPAAVIAIHTRNKGKGWGVVARALGIKPGSAAFKALKSNAAMKNQKLKEKGAKGGKGR